MALPDICRTSLGDGVLMWGFESDANLKPPCTGSSTEARFLRDLAKCDVQTMSDTGGDVWE